MNNQHIPEFVANVKQSTSQYINVLTKSSPYIRHIERSLYAPLLYFSTSKRI